VQLRHAARNAPTRAHVAPKFNEVFAAIHNGLLGRGGQVGFWIGDHKKSLAAENDRG
jgi:hypothetical protein